MESTTYRTEIFAFIFPLLTGNKLRVMPMKYIPGPVKVDVYKLIKME